MKMLLALDLAGWGVAFGDRVGVADHSVRVEVDAFDFDEMHVPVGHVDALVVVARHSEAISGFSAERRSDVRLAVGFAQVDLFDACERESVESAGRWIR